MINRGNWKLIKEYLQYRKEVDLLSEKSLRLEETWLNHLLKWAREKPFEIAPKIRPTLPEYMLDARLDGSGDTLSPAYVRKIIRASHNFLEWLRTHKRGFNMVNQAWLDTLKPPRMTIEYKEHEVVTIEEIHKIAITPVQSLKEERIRAAAVFWFLSGIRIGSFLTLPIKAVDTNNLTIKQWPKLGVQTKFQKHATTFLLEIPELIKVVRNWDDLVRNSLDENNMWFAPISPETGELDHDYFKIGKNRSYGARKDLAEWMSKNKLSYHSPHKFRHGFAVYSIKNASDIKSFKAISQNLMHSNLSITDGIYGILSEVDVKKEIEMICKKTSSYDMVDRNQLLSEAIKILKSAIDNHEE